MKRLLIAVMLFALSGCSGGVSAQTNTVTSLAKTNLATTSAVKADPSVLKAEYDKGYKKGFEDGVKSVKIPSTIPTTTPATSPETKPIGSGIYYFEAGETLTVTGDKGEYELTIEGVRVTKERNQYSDKKPVKVILLDYNYKNISVDDGVYVYSSNFNVIDAESNICDTYPVSDDSRNAKEVPPGVKSKGSEAFAITTDSPYVIIQVVTWSGKVLGETKIQLNN